MNRGPGQVDPNNALLPFAEFETLHFARFIILDDKTTEDIRVYGLSRALIRCISHSWAMSMAMRMRFWAS